MVNRRGRGGVLPGHIWAVGTLLSGVTDTQASTLAEHWNGSSWSVVPSPDPGRFGNSLASVAVLSADDVWAVGSYYYTKFGTKTLIEHWNGRAWHVVSSPDLDIDDGLASVSAVSASDLWAVGDDFEDTASGSEVPTLAEHFDGTRWTIAGTPSPRPGQRSARRASGQPVSRRVGRRKLRRQRQPDSHRALLPPPTRARAQPLCKPCGQDRLRITGGKPGYGRPERGPCHSQIDGI